MADDIDKFWCPLKGHWKHNCALERCRKCKRVHDYCTGTTYRCPKYDEFEEEKK